MTLAPHRPPPVAAEPTRAPPARSLATAPSTLVALSVAAAAVVGVACSVGPRLASAAALAVTLLALGWMRPRLVVYAAVLLAPVLPGLRRGLPVPGLRISEVLVVAAAGAALLLLGARGRATWGALDWVWLTFCGLSAVLGVWHLFAHELPLSGDGLNKAAGPLQFFLLYRAVRIALPLQQQRRTALRLVLLASVPVSLLALVQYLNLHGSRTWIIELTGSPSAPTSQFGGVIRATGTFSHYHSLAGYLLVVITLATALLLTTGQRTLARAALVAIIAVDALALLATTTLVPLTCTMLAVAAVALHRRRFGRILLAGAALAVVASMLFAGNVESRLQGQLAPQPVYQVDQHDVSWLPGNLGFRARVWSDQYLPVIEQNPVTGYGPDVPTSVTWQSTESLYVTLLIRGGLLLMAAYVLLVLAIWARARDGERDPDADTRATCLTVWVVLIAMTFAQLVHPYFTDAGLPHLLAILVGLLPVAATRRELA